MRTMLIGFGKMGKQIAHFAPLHNAQITAVVDHTVEQQFLPQSAVGYKSITDEALGNCDAIIDFSSPDDILKRVELICEAKKPIVIGTTGWNSLEPEAKKLVLKHNIGLISSPNFALGVGLFLMLSKQAASLMSCFSQYDVGIMEYHHRKKQDAPSGTALKLSQKVLEHYPQKKISLDPSRKEPLNDDELHIGWQRTGHIPGTHELIFDSADDTLTLSHTARNREAFAKGALTACSWLINKKGWFTLDDMLSDILKGRTS